MTKGKYFDYSYASFYEKIIHTFYSRIFLTTFSSNLATIIAKYSSSKPNNSASEFEIYNTPLNIST